MKPRTTTTVIAWAFGLCVTLATPWAAAQERTTPRVGVVTDGAYGRAATVLRINPLGLFVDLRLGLRTRLARRPDRPVLLQNTYVAAGVTFAASPAFLRPGVYVEAQPLQILNVQALYEPVVQWFGSFNNLQTAPGVTGFNTSDAGLARAVAMPPPGASAGDIAQTARGWQFTLQGTLQARLGESLAVRDTLRAVRQSYAASTLAQGRTHRVLYDPFYDAVEPVEGWVVTNDLDVLFMLPDVGTNLGVRYSIVAPQLDDGDDPSVVTTTHRVGPLVSYTFRERRHGFFNAPTVFVLAQWWARHAWRTGGGGDASAAWLPMIAAGFSFRSDG